MQLRVPNGPQPRSWVVLMSVELHMKQLLRCSVLQLSVHNKKLPVCSGHELDTAALGVQFNLYSSAVPVKGGKAPGDTQGSLKGCCSSGLIQSFHESIPFTFCCLLETPASKSTGGHNQGTLLSKYLLFPFCKNIHIDNARKWEIKGWWCMKNWLSELISGVQNGSSFENLFSPLINTVRHYFVLKTNVCGSFFKGKKRKKENALFLRGTICTTCCSCYGNYSRFIE